MPEHRRKQMNSALKLTLLFLSGYGFITQQVVANTWIRRLDEKILERVKNFELTLKLEISKNPIVAQVRGSGLLIGIVLKEPIAKKFVSDLQQNGILANATSDSVIRIAPPLIVSDSQVSQFTEVFRKVSANYER